MFMKIHRIISMNAEKQFLKFSPFSCKNLSCKLRLKKTTECHKTCKTKILFNDETFKVLSLETKARQVHLTSKQDNIHSSLQT